MTSAGPTRRPRRIEISALPSPVGFVGGRRELYLLNQRAGADTPYERLLIDTMARDGARFTHENVVEADALIAADGGWCNPRTADATSD